MGSFATVAVCTTAAYASSYTIYDTAIAVNANFTYTGLVRGGNCSFKITGDNATVSNALVEIFNVSSSGQFALEGISCNLTTTQSCTTNYFIVNDSPYQYVTEEFENYLPGISTTLNNLQFEQNFTYVVLPPVPSQPPLFFFDPTTISAYAIASQYSQEYGSSLVGCVLSAGGGGSNYNGADLPATLATNGAGLPKNAAAQYGVAQNQGMTFNLSSLSLYGSTQYDFVFVCYNGNGRSPGSQVFQRTTSSALPAAPQNAAASTAAVSWAAAGVVALMAALAL